MPGRAVQVSQGIVIASMIWMFAGSGLSNLALAAGGAALLAGPLNNANAWVTGHSLYQNAPQQPASSIPSMGHVWFSQVAKAYSMDRVSAPFFDALSECGQPNRWSSGQVF